MSRFWGDPGGTPETAVPRSAHITTRTSFQPLVARCRSITLLGHDFHGLQPRLQPRISLIRENIPYKGYLTTNATTNATTNFTTVGSLAVVIAIVVASVVDFVVNLWFKIGNIPPKGYLTTIAQRMQPRMQPRLRHNQPW